MAALNGRIPLASLVHIGTDAYGRAAYLTADAAASWDRMVAAGMPVDISDAYRDYNRQVRYYNDPPNDLGFAAVPGTSSHGWGRAVDARGACLTWLARHGAAHGWVRTVPRESWHFERLPARDTHKGDDMPLTQTDLTAIAQVVRDNGVGYSNPNLDERDVLAILRSTNAYAASVSVRLAAQDAQITNLIGAVAALSRGEQFDESKLLAGVRAAAQAGVEAAVGDAIELDVTVTPRKD